MKITIELIDAGKSFKGGWTKEQLTLLGVDCTPWPPKPGWQSRIIGNPISDADAQQFLALGHRKVPLSSLQAEPHEQTQNKSHVSRLIAEGKSLIEVEDDIHYPD